METVTNHFKDFSTNTLWTSNTRPGIWRLRRAPMLPDRSVPLYLYNDDNQDTITEFDPNQEEWTIHK